MSYKFDCNTINKYFIDPENETNDENQKCIFLPSTDKKMSIKSRRKFICPDLDKFVWADIINFGRINEESIGLSPNVECSVMQKLRKMGIANSMEFTILPNGKTIDWNELE